MSLRPALSEKEVIALQMWLADASLSEIHERLGYSSKVTTHQVLNGARKKIALKERDENS